MEDLEIKDWLTLDRERAYYKVLEGKTVNFIGDSLFAGHSLGKNYTWPALMLGKYYMHGENHGISGCTLSACEDGQNPIISRFEKLPDNDPDIVISVIIEPRDDQPKDNFHGSSYACIAAARVLAEFYK